MVRVLFKVHLSFCLYSTSPANPSEASGALYMSTATVVFRDGHATLQIRAGLSAKLHEESCELLFVLTIALIDILNLFCEFVLI